MKRRALTATGLALLLSAILLLSACGNGNGNGNGNGSGNSGGNAASKGNTGTSGNQASGNEQTPASTAKADEGNASATAEPKEQVTVDFWHAYGEGEEKVLLEKVIPKFEEQNPSIKIKATRMPTEGLDQQVLTAAAGGTPPDVMRMDNTWVPNMAKQGALQEISGMPGAQDILNGSYKGTVDTNLYNGKYYGVPLDTNTRVAIYNQELLQQAGATEAPKTMDELADLARKLKSQGKYYGMTIGGVDVWNFSSWFWSLGGKYTDDAYTKATGYLNSPESVQALEKIYGWYKEGLLAPPILGGQPGTWDGLRGKDAVKASYMMIDDGPWFFSLIGDADTKGKMLPALIPAGPDGSSHSVVGGEDMVIFNGAKHSQEAWTFVQYMTSTDVQVLMAKETGQIPTNMQAAEAPELKDVWYLQTYFDQLKTAYTRTPSPNANQINDVIQKAFESVLRDKAKAQEALDGAAAQVDALLVP